MEFLCAQDDEIFPFWSAASAQVTHCTTDQAAHGATDLPLPGCATIDDRPARKLAAPVGGLVIEAFDLRTGLLEAEPVCPPPCPGHPGDGEAADAPAFEQRLVSLRHDLAEGA